MKNEFDSDMLRIQNECAIVVLYWLSRYGNSYFVFTKMMY
ncbi:Uncharacterized protein XB17_03594 [Leptospira santarosai]|nr:Uncharacterized protein XB17_03594 [Leptospira santarosai]AVV81142.1 Uncharacterized protein XB15_03405 [Leptospira santarosai]